MCKGNFRVITKIIFCVLAIYIICSNLYIVKASDLLTNMTGQASNFVNAGAEAAEGINYTKISDEFKGLGQILTMVGAGVLVAVTTYMGIKYLTAGPEAQAKLKVQLIGVVVSAVVIFGAYSIWKIVISVASGF